MSTRSSTGAAPSRADPAPAAPAGAFAGFIAALWRRRWAAGFVAALAAGIVFRLIWLADVEYKADEAWTVEAVRAFWQTHMLRPVGIPSSAGLPHPGLSLWLFLAISAVLPAAGPLELTRAVQLTNVVALILLVVFVQRSLARPEREPWLWATALYAVNPLAVLFSRKLWAQDVLPLFSLAMLAGWWHRGTRWGAALWGFAGALLGQVHLTGFVFAGAFFAIVLLFDRRSVRWFYWLGGSVAGALPLIPWLLVARQYSENQQPLTFNNPAIPFGDWVNFALGTALQQPLGNDFGAFLASPSLAARPTYLAALMLCGIVAIFVTLIVRFIRRLHTDHLSSLTLFFADRSSTNLAINAAFFLYCTLLFLIPRPVYLHYMIVAFVLPPLWLAWVARQGSTANAVSIANTRRLLAALVFAQAALTLMFLAFIHQVQVIDGDYGAAFGSQAHRF